eukprot:8082364-Alexandrium_andersonii.AAC.1
MASLAAASSSSAPLCLMVSRWSSNAAWMASAEKPGASMDSSISSSSSLAATPPGGSAGSTPGPL